MKCFSLPVGVSALRPLRRVPLPARTLLQNTNSKVWTRLFLPLPLVWPLFRWDKVRARFSDTCLKFLRCLITAQWIVLLAAQTPLHDWPVQRLSGDVTMQKKLNQVQLVWPCVFLGDHSNAPTLHQCTSPLKRMKRAVTIYVFVFLFSSEVFRLNLEQGRFLNSLQTDAV